MMSCRTSRRWIGLVLVLALLFAACGVPNDGGPIAISESSLPIDLTENAPPTPLPESTATNTQIWMVGDDNRLSTVGREITRTPEGVMNSLLLGTDTNEREAGITTAITRETGYTAPIGFNPATGVAVVNLTPGSLRGNTTAEQKLAFAQIVYSLIGLNDAQNDVTGVAFTIDDAPIQIPIDGGASSVGQVLTKDDFASLNRQRVSFVDDEDEPLQPQPTPTRAQIGVAPIGDGSQLVDMTVWMVASNNTLARVTRNIEESPEAVMFSLLLGPTIPETGTGVTSAILPDAVTLTIDVNEADGVAFVDMSAGSLPETGTDRLRAVAQIVFSLTELDEVSTVNVSIDGVRQLLTDTGLQALDPTLVRSDFLELAPADLDELGYPIDPDAEPTVDPLLTPGPEAGAAPAPSSEAEDDSADVDAADSTPTAIPTQTPTPAPTPEPTPEP